MMGKNRIKRKLTITDDGSHTLFVPELNEHYHSTHGAIQESAHVFINNGLNFVIDELRKKNREDGCIKILEVGFGTGLNALLTCQKATEVKQTVSFTSVEKYPITIDEINKLNFAKKLGNGYDACFKKMHNAKWGDYEEITPNFRLKKLETDLLDFKPDDLFHLIYFDAFSPNVQPKLWTESVFKQMHNCLLPNGILVTYSAKGLVKQNLRSAGFSVKRLPGPPGKWQMLRAQTL